jgi:ADP-dependent phosphofructokinase/glucokinase
VCAVPALVLRTATPTTIGLGDTFVGGFVAALAGAGRGVADGAA